MKTFAVLGATGRTGGATARALLDLGHRVRAVTRRADSNKARSLSEAGAQVIEADMESENSLLPGFDGVDGVFCVQPAFDARGRHDPDSEVRQGLTVSAALRRAGTPRAVFLSAGPGYPTGIGHFDTKIEIEASLHEACAQVTALRPSSFMELMVDPSFAPALSTWGVMPKVVGWDTPVPWVAVHDLGVVAARVLSDAAFTDEEELFLAGDVCTLRTAWSRLSESGLAPRRRLPVPVWALRMMAGSELIDMWRFMREASSMSELSPGRLRSIYPQAMTVERWVEARTAAE